MPKKRHTPEEIINHLRTVEIEPTKGLALEERVSQGRSDTTSYLTVQS